LRKKGRRKGSEGLERKDKKEDGKVRKGDGYQGGRRLITEPTTLIVVDTSAVLPIRGE
jgi:hypothetical protein